MRRQWTLLIKIQLLIVAILLISYVAVEVTILNLIGLQMQAKFNEGVENTVILTQRNIEALFGEANHIINYVGDTFETYEASSIDTAKSLEAIGLSNNIITNIYVAYEDGSFEVSPERLQLPEDYDPRIREWYKRAYRRSEVKWSNPYNDLATGKRVITGSKYTRMIDGEAVVGVDIDLTSLMQIIRVVEVSEHGIIALLNEDQHIIATNNSDMMDLTIIAFDDTEMIESRIVTGEFVTDKGLYYFRRLNQSNMRLMAFIPHDDIVGVTSRAQVIMTLIITLILIVSMLISHGITRRVMRPLTMLKNVMIQSKNKGEILLFDEQTNDEINTVIKAYNGLANGINEQSEEIMRLAYEDDLTGLPNRASFVKIATKGIENCERVALLYLDIDNFKYVNDTYGHAYGDKVLICLADSLTECCKGQYTISRLSGDEFGILALDYKDDLELEEIAKKVLHVIKRPMYLEQLEISLTGSVGVSRYPMDAMDYESLLANADMAMYGAKTKNKDNYLMFDLNLRQDFLNQIYMETRLAQSIRKGEFYPVFQPIINLESKKISGFEVLSRWIDPELGQIVPDVFIPIAERNLFIIDIGCYVLDKAVELGRKIFDEFGHYFEINVNVSVVQLHNEGFIDEVLEILDKYKLPSRFLNLEITESVALESDENLMMKLVYLRKKGVQISLDDFGTGYSSLSHLTDLSLTHIKLDRQLILKAGQSEEIFQLLKGIVEFAHTMYYKVVAEGIENKEMEAMVDLMHADFVQGYMYDKPLYAEQLIERIREQMKQ